MLRCCKLYCTYVVCCVRLCSVLQQQLHQAVSAVGCSLVQGSPAALKTAEFGGGGGGGDRGPIAVSVAVHGRSGGQLAPRRPRCSWQVQLSGCGCGVKATSRKATALQLGTQMLTACNMPRPRSYRVVLHVGVCVVELQHLMRLEDVILFHGFPQNSLYMHQYISAGFRATRISGDALPQIQLTPSRHPRCIASSCASEAPSRRFTSTLRKHFKLSIDRITVAAGGAWPAFAALPTALATQTALLAPCWQPNCLPDWVLAQAGSTLCGLAEGAARRGHRSLLYGPGQPCCGS